MAEPTEPTKPTGSAGAGDHERAAALAELLDQVAIGILWFDGDGRVTWVNQGAHVMLRLPAFIDPEAELDRLAAIRDERGRSIAEIVRDDRRGALRGSWTGATITLADGTTLAGRIRVARRLQSLAGRDAIVVTVWGPTCPQPAAAPPHADDSERARQVLARLGMTEREADVAVLLLQGFRVATIAQQLHHSPHTIRNRLKRLFQKTGTASQPELVAVLRGHLDAPRRAGAAPEA